MKRIMNKKIVYLFFILAFLLLFMIKVIGIALEDNIDQQLLFDDISFERESSTYFTEHLACPEGIYDISIDYDSDTDFNVEVTAEQISHKTIFADTPSFCSGKAHKTFSVWVNDDCEQMTIKLHGESDNIKINSIRIKSSWNSKLYRIIKISLVLLFLIFVLFVYVKRDLFRKYSFEIFGILGIATFASLGALVRYIIPGDDLYFHLMRIEGLKEAFLLGDIPCRIQTNWFDGWGSAVSIMYGDVSLVLPAVMRLMGFTLITSYSVFVVVINTLTAISAFYAFVRLTNNKYISMLVCGLYVLSPYRLCDIYVRGAFGEYISMIFLPLVVLFFYYVFAKDVNGDDYGKQIIIPVIGLSGVIQTHVLTIAMILVFGTIFLLFNYKELFVFKRIKYALKICSIVILVNMWFLIPFLRFLSEDLNVNSKAYHPNDYQWYGLTIAEIVAQKASPSMGYNWANNSSLSNRMGLAVGNGFLIFLIIYFYLLINKKIEKNKKASLITAVLGICALLLTSIYFPYAEINKHIPILFSILAKVKIPFRYMSIALVMFSFLILFSYENLNNCFSKILRYGIFMGLGLISIIQSFDYMYSYIYSGESFVCYDGSTIKIEDSELGEYLYQGVSIYDNHNNDFLSSGCSIEDKKINHNRYDIKLNVNNENAYIELPLNYYPGYSAYSSEGGKLRIEKGTNGRLKVNIPTIGINNIRVRYKGFISWKIADIISLLSILLLLSTQFNNSKHKTFNQITLKVKKTMKEKRWISLLFFGLILCVVFVGILYLNLHTELVSDDVMYLYSFRTGWPETDTHRFTLSDLFSSMSYHRKIWNGRVVAHGLLQVLLMLPPIPFRIVNSLFFIILGLLVYFHSTYKNKKSKSLIVLIYIFIWFFVPNFGQTILWASGAASYLWCTCIILAILIPYRVYIVNDKIGGKFFSVFMLLFGIIAGCTNENTGGALVLLCMSFCLYYYLLKKHIPLWAITGVLGEIIGVLFLVTANGNKRIDSSTDIRGYIERLKIIVNMFFEKYILLAFFIIIMLIINYASSKEKVTKKKMFSTDIFFSVAFVLSGLASVGVLMFSAIFPLRAMFVASVFLIIVFGINYSSVVNKLGDTTSLCICIMAVLLCIESYRYQSQNILDTWKQVDYGLDLIKDAHNEGKASVEVPLLQLNGSEYDAFSETQYLNEDSGSWFNTWMKYKYGVEITGY